MKRLLAIVFFAALGVVTSLALFYLIEYLKGR